MADQLLAEAGAFGVDSAIIVNGVLVKHGKKSFIEFGANLSARFQKDVFKNVNISSKLVLFNNYTDKDKANRKNIDVNCEVMMNIKSGKYLTTSVFANPIYDQNIIQKTQFKEVIGVLRINFRRREGLSYEL